MLVEDRVAALARDEEVRPGLAVEQQQRQPRRQGRQDATIRSQAYTSIVQTKSGMRIHVMPAVRMLWIVTMKLIAPASDPIERMWRPRIQ